jgi:cholesterol transport system auxiliary component
MALLSGCAALPEKPVRPAVYDFGPAPLTQPGVTVSMGVASAIVTFQVSPNRKVATMPLPALLLADIQAPAALDGTAMLYRLAYADARQLRPYAQARWSMTPAQLVRQRLREQLSAQRTVLNPGEAPANLTLRLELEEFTQIFDQPDHASAQVRLRATLVDTQAGRERLLAQRQASAQRPAPSPDAAGGVQALAAATDAVVAELVQWVGQVNPQVISADGR